MAEHPPGRPGGLAQRARSAEVPQLGRSAEPSNDRHALVVRAWDAICRHIDGMAIGSTMAALREHGVLDMLASADRIEFRKLCAAIGANPGFLRVAIRLLADQGWVTCSRDDTVPGELVITPTSAGRVVMTELAVGYTRAVGLLDVAGRVASGEVGADVLAPFTELARDDWGLGVEADRQGSARHQVLAHLNGHLIAPVMVAQTRGFAAPSGVLALQGWDGTPEGEIAAALAVQYRYPIVYLPLLRGVWELIFGDPSRAGSRDDEEETHLDRDLDLRFSGEVFAKLCRTPFCEIALPLFDREPIRDQPGLVVDVGCGDGALLEALYTEVRARTARGRRLAEHPLLMVGVDPSPVAREMTAARLGKAGIPHLVMPGDIADPQGLAHELAAAGYDATNALHVCKSAIHDRAARQTHDPRQGWPSVGPPPRAMTAFARPDGAVIDPADLAADLAGVFRAWRPLADRHGWIVIEAHSAPSSTVASLIGRTIATALDATHGYSCQYPVEPEVFMWAARAGGFTSRAHHEPGASALGHTQLTIDHFVPIRPSGPAGRMSRGVWGDGSPQEETP